MGIIGLITLLVVLSFSLLFLFLWFRRRQAKKKEEELEDLSAEFSDNPQQSIEEPSTEDKEMLERVEKNIKEASKEGKNSVELSLQNEYDIRVEAPDVIVLQTPDCNLYKSFPKTRFEKLEKTEEGTQLHLLAS